MKPRTLILMGVAVVCGLVASYLTSRMLAQQTPADQKKVSVLVAKEKIPHGTQIKDPEKFFVFKEYVEGTEPKRALKTFEEVKDRRMNKTISPEVFLTPDDLMSKQDEAMAGIIPVGMRAFAMTVKSDTSVAGFVLPLMHVDIIGTIRTSKGPMAKTLLQNILVLGVDNNMERKSESSSMPSSTVTLQIKPQEAEQLPAAISTGDLRLVLRGQDDNTKVTTTGVRPEELTKAGQPGGNIGDAGAGPDENEGNSGTKVTSKVPDPGPGTPGVEAVKPAPPVEPETTKYVLTIIQGSSTTRHTTVLDKKTGQPVDTDVQKTPAVDPKPAPPAAEAKEPIGEGK